VALDAPASVALRVAGQTVHADLPAGTSRVALPPLSAGEHAVALVATDAAGRRAADHTRVFADGWLPVETARLVIDSRRPDAASYACRRFSASRVDCRLERPFRRDCSVVSVRYLRERLYTAAYAGCAFHARPRLRRPLHVLRRSEWRCPGDEPGCRPALFGRVTEAQLVPGD
jgi:hypothetical protein